MSKWAWSFLVTVTIIVFIFSQSVALEAKSAEQADSDIPLIWNLASGFMKDQMKLVIRHGGDYRPYATDLEFQKQAIDLGNALGLPKGVFEKHEEHPIYRIAMQESKGVTLIVLLMGTDRQVSYLTITRESTNENALLDAVRWERNISNILLSHKSKPKWNIMVQGMEREGAPSNQDFSPLLRNLAARMDANEIEEYEDTGTLSTTYNSSILHSDVWSGTKRVNLQVALHKVTETNSWRMTIGTPLITIEY